MLFATPEEHANFVAAEIADLLNSSIQDRQGAVLAVSGGKSPILLFEALSLQSIAWSLVTVLLVDERWVLTDDERSNEKLVRTHLIQRQALAAKFISLRHAGDTPALAAQSLSAMFVNDTALVNGVDLVVLGVGDDGHTASWFPRSRELAHCLVSVNAFEPVSAEAGREARVTMTLPPIAAARQVFICAAGESKRAILLKAQEAGDVKEYPVRAALRLSADQVRVRLF